ncbi:MAG: hypothetical protein ABSH49_30745 [Bryobacteraceae bacterium]
MAWSIIAPARCSLVLTLVTILAPVFTFFTILNKDVPLVPLVGVDAACAECDRKATRTLKSVAAALRVKGVYVYDKEKYPKGAPAWCEQHGPDKAVENAGTAYIGAIAVFVASVALYKRIAPA